MDTKNLDVFLVTIATLKSSKLGFCLGKAERNPSK